MREPLRSLGRLGVAVGIAALLACAAVVPWGRLYRGDGEYVKTPGMHQIRLGIVPQAPGARELTVRNLGPPWEWTLGLRVEPSDASDDLGLIAPGTTDLRPELVPDAEVILTVVNERGETVISEAGPLAQWEWNWNHARRSGRGEQYRAGPGSNRFRRFGVRADGGWGTDFTPRYSGIYRVRYEVVRAGAPKPDLQLWLTVERYIGSL